MPEHVIHGHSSWQCESIQFRGSLMRHSRMTDLAGHPVVDGGRLAHRCAPKLSQSYGLWSLVDGVFPPKLRIGSQAKSHHMVDKLIMATDSTPLTSLELTWSTPNGTCIAVEELHFLGRADEFVQNLNSQTTQAAAVDLRTEPVGSPLWKHPWYHHLWLCCVCVGTWHILTPSQQLDVMHMHTKERAPSTSWPICNLVLSVCWSLNVYGRYFQAEMWKSRCALNSLSV